MLSLPLTMFRFFARNGTKTIHFMFFRNAKRSEFKDYSSRSGPIYSGTATLVMLDGGKCKGVGTAESATNTVSSV